MQVTQKSKASFSLMKTDCYIVLSPKDIMDGTLEDFTGIAEDDTKMGELYIPLKMRAIWNLKNGDFEYFNCTITDYKID